jgi:hypothetical protein
MASAWGNPVLYDQKARADHKLCQIGIVITMVFGKV